MKPLYDGEFSTLKGEHELVAENVGLKRKLEAGMEQDGEQVGRDARCVQIVPGKWSVVYGDDPTHPGYANILELANAQEFMDWWKESHERMEASDKFNHTIDYAAAAWDAALTESAALHAEIAKLETIGIEQLAEIQRLTAELARVRTCPGCSYVNRNHINNCPVRLREHLDRLRAELSRERERHQDLRRDNQRLRRLLDHYPTHIGHIGE